jgi:hypothetical protein
MSIYMNKKQIFHNLTFILFGFIVLFTLGLAHASSTFIDATSSAPNNNIDVPLHTGPDQVKNGSISVDTFSAYQNASFFQQVFLTGAVFGGHPGDASSTLYVGTGPLPTNLAADGAIQVAGSITSGSVANQNSGALCADANGNIILCTPASGTPPPSNPTRPPTISTDPQPQVQ